VANQQFTPFSLIQKKRDGGKLTKEEIQWFVQGLFNGQVADYQMSAMLMAIYLKGMNSQETADLTDVMLYSGKVLLLNDSTIIDKHSTGGVGDKTSFILAPLAAACGVKVAMISGRGLGHTGGTVDKLEAIPGYRTDFSLDDFCRLLYEQGIVMVGQTADLAPADKRIYGLRDVTATVESIPLITASIMSKKLAEGASGFVMDVKTGPGAFMKTLPRSRALAQSLRQTALRFKKNIITMITDMSQPLGQTVGHSLEIIESIEVLKNRGPKDITELSVQLAGGMVHLAGLAPSFEAGVKKVLQALKSGKGLEKFKQMIAAQGGNSEVVDNYFLLPTAQDRSEVPAEQSGYVASIECEKLGLCLIDFGGGRKSANDQIDFAVGFTMRKKIGDKVVKGESLLTIHHHPHQKELATQKAQEISQKIYTYKKQKVSKKPLIIEKKICWST